MGQSPGKSDCFLFGQLGSKTGFRRRLMAGSEGVRMILSFMEALRGVWICPLVVNAC
jgi:hypothetical protein